MAYIVDVIAEERKNDTEMCVLIKLTKINVTHSDAYHLTQMLWSPCYCSFVLLLCCVFMVKKSAVLVQG